MLLFQINGELWSLFFTSIIFIIWVLFLILKSKRDKVRTEGLQEIAKKMGLNFSHRGSQRLQNRLARFNFMSKRSKPGVGFWITNVVEGNTGKIHLSIFNVRYNLGSKKAHTTYRAYLLLRSKTLVCPEFRVEPESFLDKLDHSIGIGWQDIDFDKFPVFSSRFLVSSPNEVHFRKFFNVKAIPFFLSHPDLTVETKLNEFLFHLPVDRISAEDVEEYITDAIDLYNLLASPEQTSN